MDIREVSKVTETEGLSVLGVQGDNLVQADAEKVIEQSAVVGGLKMLGWSVPSEMSIKNYVADGVFHQRVGRVDLSKIDWSRHSTVVNLFETTSLSSLIKKSPSYSISSKAYVNGYELVEWRYVDESGDKKIAINEDGYFRLYDMSYTDANAFKQAMQGVYLYYELAEEILIPIDGNEAVAKINDSMSDYGLDNKFDGVLKRGDYDATDGSYNPNSTVYVCNIHHIPCKPNDIIKVVCDSYHTDIYVMYYTSNGSYISSQNNVETFVAPQNASYFNFDIERRPEGITPQTAGRIGVYVNNEVDVVKKSLAKRVVIPSDVKPHHYLNTVGEAVKSSPYSIITVPVESSDHYVFYGLATNPGVRSQLINESNNVKEYYIHYSDSWDIEIPNDDLYFVRLTVFNSEGLPTFEKI